jgi:ABC-type molybdenum transport system ATPase subunit/photorepair protein PhrA
MARNASFIEVNAPNYNRQAVLDISLPLFAVLGATGVGKSTFITTLGGRHVSTNELPVIGHRLESREFSKTIEWSILGLVIV